MLGWSQGAQCCHLFMFIGERRPCRCNKAPDEIAALLLPHCLLEERWRINECTTDLWDYVQCSSFVWSWSGSVMESRDERSACLWSLFYNKVLSEQVECKALCMCNTQDSPNKTAGQWRYFPVMHTIEDLWFDMTAFVILWTISPQKRNRDESHVRNEVRCIWMCFIVMHAAGAEKRGMITYNVANQDVTLWMEVQWAAYTIWHMVTIIDTYFVSIFCR